ncbi:MAG: IclR family transcriptional regulator [Nocardioidaceae bacterium]
MTAETSQTLDRGIQLMQLAAASGAAGMTITELARELEVGRPVVYRLVATLSEHDLVRRARDGRVRLGLGVLGFATAVHPTLREAATPILRKLADAAGASAHLTVAEGGEALALVVVEPTWTEFHVSYRVGSRHLLGRGAAGHAILEGRQGRAGVVSTSGELQQGATGLAAPVLGVPGLQASVGVVTMQSFDDPRVGENVLQAAEELASSLKPA